MTKLFINLAEAEDNLIDILEDKYEYSLEDNILSFAPITTFLRKNINCIIPDDLLTNDDQYFIADIVLDLSNSWWGLLFPNIVEPDIEGLRITEVFNYEFEQAISAILYKLLVIQKAIEKLTPQKVIFIVNQVSYDNETYLLADCVNQPNGLIKYLHHYDLMCLIASNSLFKEISFEKLQVNKPDDHNRLFGRKIIPRGIKYLKKRGVKSVMLYFSHLNISKLRKHSNKDEIIIYKGERCLGAFIAGVEKKYRISFFNFKGRELKNCELRLLDKLNCSSEKYVIGKVSYCDILFAVADYSINRFGLLEEYYVDIQESKKRKNIKLFLTVDQADSFSRINLWAFHKLGVRTCWHPDGLGQPMSKVWKYYSSASWYNDFVEKWLISENAVNEYESHKMNNTKLSGYLEKGFNNKDENAEDLLKKRLGISPKHQVITYATSTANMSSMRLVVEETLFEILKGINDFIEVLKTHQNFFLIVKLHPGFSRFENYLKEKAKNSNNIKIISDFSISRILSLSDIVVVYHSSVGLESLYRNKHLIIYNHTKMPSFLTEIYKYLNKDPNNGPAAQLIRNKKNIISSIEFLNSGEGLKAESMNLEYVLENAKSKYNVNSTVNNLING